MANGIEPNLYELNGEGIAVTYSTTSIDGKPRLTYMKGRKSLSFAGKEILSTTTPLGTLVGVLIASVPDQSSTTFSFLLPGIQLAASSKKQSFRTVGITTTEATSIAGPVKGVQQTYKTVALRGSGKQVEFLAKKMSAAAGAF
jgi:hypothetical protein